MSKVLGGALIVVIAIVLALAAWMVVKDMSEGPAPQQVVQTVPAVQETTGSESKPAPEPAEAAKPEAPAPSSAPAKSDTASTAPANLRSIADGPIQAEDYDQGGEGKGYHDTTGNNIYGNYRQDGVDIETFEPGSYSIGSIAAGEWLAYTLSVPESAEYEIDLHTATPRSGNQILVYVDKTMAGSPITVPTTSGWGDFQTFTTPASFKLEAGAHTFRLEFPQGFVNIDWFQFHKVRTQWPVGGVAAVRTVWDLTNQAAEGTTVTLMGQSEGGRWRAMGVTDANGDLALEFPDFAKTAKATAQHAYSRLKTIDATMLPPAQPIVIRLERETTLFGTVMLAGSGQPAAGATIEALGSGLSVKSEADGSWEIVGVTQKSLRLIASKDDLVSYKDESEIPNIFITSGAPNGPHNLILKEGPMLTGRVTDEETGQGVAGAKMTARLMGADFTKVHETKTGEDGRYKMPGLWGDRYTMVVDSDDHVQMNMMMALGRETRGERDFALEPGSVIHATVKDINSGAPIKDAEFSAITDYNWNNAGAKTDEKGVADIKRISRKQTPDIVARHNDYSQSDRVKPAFADGARETTMEFTLAPSEKTTTEQTIKFFVGRVTDKESNPVADATIRWGNRWSLQNSSETTETDADGRYRLECKRPYYEYNVLAVSAEDFAPAWRTNVRPGAEDAPMEVNFVLGEGHWLNVTVVDEEKAPIPDAGLSVNVITNDNYGNLTIPGIATNLKTDDQGKVRFEGLPGPSIQISAQKSGYTPRDGETTAVDRDLTIELKPAAVILGRLLDKEAQSPITEFNVKVEGRVNDYERTRKGESVADRDGQFKLSDLAMTQSYTLTFSAEGYPPAIEKGVVALRESEAKEKTYYITKGKGLNIEVVSAAGENDPIAGVDVTVAMRNPQSGSYMQIQWDSLTQNEWMWRNVQSKTTNELGRVSFDEGSEKFTIFIKTKGYQRLHIAPDARRGYVAEEGDGLRIALQPESVIEGVYSLKGQPQSGQSVTLSRHGNNFNEQVGSEKTTADGRFEFASLGAGEYQLGVTKTLGNRSYSSMNKKVSLKAAERLSVVLGEDLGPYAMWGKITRDGQPMPNSGVNASNAFGWDYTNLSGQAGDDGTYRIEGLKPGLYNVNVYYHGNAGDYLNKQEKITISGDLEKDFEFGGAFKVVAKLKFPETMPADVRGRYQSAQLQYMGGDWAELQSQGYDNWKHANIMGDQLELKGRFKGKYGLSLTYSQASGQGVSMPVPGSPFEIDTIEQDHDLGEILVPMPGGLKMELVFERPENRERYSQVTLQAANNASYSAPNPDGISYNATSPITDNPVQVAGRFKGDYRITVSKDQNWYMENVMVPGTFTVANPDVETDLGRVVVPPVYDVRGRLIIPEEETGQYTVAALRFGQMDGPGDSPEEGFTRAGTSPIGPDGSFVVTGRFNGKYVLALGQGQNIGYGEGFALPQTFEINNLNSDVDLGDIEIMGSGKVKLVITHSDAEKRPQFMMAFVIEDNTMHGQYQIEMGQPEQEIGPLPAGETTLRFLAPGFQVEPGVATVTISPDDTPVLALTTTPEGMIIGMVNDPNVKGEVLKVTSVSVEGAGLSRSLTPREGTINDILEIWAGGEDVAINSKGASIFVFHQLPEGEYTVRVEAEGYEPMEKQNTVKPGSQQMDEMNFTLVKTGAATPTETPEAPPVE